MQKEMATIEGKTKGEIMIEYWKTYFQALLNEQAGSQKLKEMGLQMGFEAGKFMAGQEAPQGVEQQGMLQEGMPPTSEPPAPEQV